MKTKKTILAVVLLAVSAGLILLPSMTEGKKTVSDEVSATPATVFTVRTEDAETRTLQAYIEVNANIVSGHQVAVMPDAGGRLVSMRVNLGTVVQRGQLLAEVDPSRPGSDYALSPVYAPVSGTVVSAPQTVGSTVSTATSLMILAVNGSIEIEALIPEREVGQLRTGLNASIRLEAFPGETFAATLTQVSPVLDPVSRTKKITMRFDQNDTRINPGMFARVKLNTRTYENVVSVPQEAVVEHRGKTVVYVLETDELSATNVRAQEVSTGVNVDREVEIKNGLAAGEVVVVQGQQFLTDGAPVRVLGKRI
jgi:multidrug efflux pump subunit AcrA (membrane-fusion protein)